MSPAARIWTVIFAVFVSSFLSALLISRLLLESGAVFVVVVFDFFGTAIAGAPLSLLLHRLVRLRGAAGFLLQLILHALSGALLVNLGCLLAGVPADMLFRSGAELFVYAGAVNGAVYCCVYRTLRAALSRPGSP